MISTVTRLLNDMLSLKTDVNVLEPTVRGKKKEQKNLFFVGILKATSKTGRIKCQGFGTL
jgi:hypothetical protein